MMRARAYVRCMVIPCSCRRVKTSLRNHIRAHPSLLHPRERALARAPIIVRPERRPVLERRVLDVASEAWIELRGELRCKVQARMKEPLITSIGQKSA